MGWRRVDGESGCSGGGTWDVWVSFGKLKG